MCVCVYVCVNVVANFELDCAMNATTQTSGNFYGTRQTHYFAIATSIAFKTDRKRFYATGPWTLSVSERGQSGL